MKELRRLNLGAINVLLNSDPYSFNRELFPAGGKLLQLTDLRLDGFAIGGYYLVCLPFHTFPQLQRLDIFNIQLLSGTWEGVIEGLHGIRGTLIRPLLRSLQLGPSIEDLEVRDGPPFVATARHHDGRVIDPEDLQDYVILGGKHPCLPGDSAPEDALRYVWDMYPAEKAEKTCWSDFQALFLKP